MQIPQRAFPENAVAARGQFQLRYLNPWLSDGAILASNTYIAVRVPVDASGDDEPGSIPLDAVKAARRNKATLTLKNGRADVAGYASFEAGGEPPDIEKHLNEHLNRPELVSVGINPALLLQASKALGARHGLRLTITEPNKPVIIRSLSNEVEGAVGLIMPIMLRGHKQPDTSFADAAAGMLKRYGWTEAAGKWSKGKRKSLTIAGAVKAELA